MAKGIGQLMIVADLKVLTYPQRQDQSCLCSTEHYPSDESQCSCLPDWPFTGENQQSLEDKWECLLMIDQSLCPADETKGPEALWLNLDWYVEILQTSAQE